ncbi:hypothetical protein, partial [Nonomuraea sp. NPDC023979]|uniref:hypothetical protein n=1 Tax=Nonomuraea sp. NPDC023979 TaxID=3154796 RepID=UPI0033E88C24
MDADTERRWLAWLGADAGKAAASLRRADEDVAAFERTVQAARAAGMSERKILGAVARYDVDIPDPDGQAHTLAGVFALYTGSHQYLRRA